LLVFPLDVVQIVKNAQMLKNPSQISGSGSRCW